MLTASRLAAGLFSFSSSLPCTHGCTHLHPTLDIMHPRNAPMHPFCTREPKWVHNRIAWVHHKFQYAPTMHPFAPTAHIVSTPLYFGKRIISESRSATSPSSFRTVLCFDGLLPLSAPREPHVCPVTGFPGQNNRMLAIPAPRLRQGMTK